MTISKKKISGVISTKLGLSISQSTNLLNSFLNVIKLQLADGSVKLPGFGTFYIKESVERMGRNPKNLENFVIKKRKKLNLKISNKIKKVLN
tara:strand:+ start:1274 stop:1549 length:276 start_codon:yes stop_codon:yes gene_type:complete